MKTYHDHIFYLFGEGQKLCLVFVIHFCFTFKLKKKELSPLLGICLLLGNQEHL